MKIIPPSHLVIWILLAFSNGAWEHLAAQKLPFPESLEIEGVNAWDAFADNISKYGDDYLFINGGDTINLTRWVSRADILKKAADYLSLNPPIVKTDTLEFNSTTDSLASIDWGDFHLDIMNPENSVIILNHYIAADDEKILAKFGDLNRHKSAIFRHEYKHYLNEILILNNIQNLVPEEIYLLCVLNEVSALMTVNAYELVWSVEPDAFVQELVDEYIALITKDPDERRKFEVKVQNYLKRYVGPALVDTNKTVFYSVASAMFSYTDSSGKKIEIEGKNIIEYAVDLIQNIMPNYERIIKNLNDRAPSPEPLTEAYTNLGSKGFDEQMENWIQMAKEKKF